MINLIVILLKYIKEEEIGYEGVVKEAMDIFDHVLISNGKNFIPTEFVDVNAKEIDLNEIYKKMKDINPKRKIMSFDLRPFKQLERIVPCFLKLPNKLIPSIQTGGLTTIKELGIDSDVIRWKN